MADEAVLSNFNSLVSQMMKEKGIENSEIDITGNSGIGDGYMGDVIFFKVKKDGKTLDYVMKIAKNNEVLRNTTNLVENFKREIFMYNTVFKTIESYFAEKRPTVEVLEYIPKIFWSCEEERKEALVMENLKADGFTSWKKGEPLDFEHTKLVLRNLAKWHGEVMAFRDQNPAQFQSWIPKLENIRYELIVQLDLLNHALKNYQKVINILETRGQHELAQKFKAEEKNLDRHAHVANEEKDRLVITHADLWINNILFKFPDDGTTAIKNKFFDFQVANINTPVEDVTFFIYGHCDKDVLEKVDILMEDYFATLSDTVKKLGSDIEKIFTYAQFEEHWRKYGMFGLIASTEIIKLQLLVEEEVQAYSEDIMNYVIKNEDIYLERLVNLFIHFGNRFL